MTREAHDVAISGKANAAIVTSGDRMSFALFMAFVLHAVLILGVRFVQEDHPPAPFTVAVTLTAYDESEAPEDADFIAPTNQRGSGTKEKKAELTSPPPKPLTQAEPPKIAPVKPTEKQKEKISTPVPKVVTTKSVAKINTKKKKTDKSNVKEEKKSKKSLMKNALEIASLEAKLDYQQRNFAKRPRTARLTAVSAKSAASAFYMHNWVQQVERVGNLNYPREARKRNLSGKVRVAVLIKNNGRVGRIEILESSGHSVLDDAVIRIVNLAAPFGPFTESMLKEADQFEIIRTFAFGRGISSF